MTYLYILTDGQLYKIGITNNLDARLKQNQTGNPYRLWYVLNVAYRDRSEAERIEAWALRFGRPTGGGSEWRELSVSELRKIRNALTGQSWLGRVLGAVFGWLGVK